MIALLEIFSSLYVVFNVGPGTARRLGPYGDFSTSINFSRIPKAGRVVHSAPRLIVFNLR